MGDALVGGVLLALRIRRMQADACLNLRDHAVQLVEGLVHFRQTFGQLLALGLELGALDPIRRQQLFDLGLLLGLDLGAQRVLMLGGGSRR